jgi:hypothetical protein
MREMFLMEEGRGPTRISSVTGTILLEKSTLKDLIADESTKMVDLSDMTTFQSLSWIQTLRSWKGGETLACCNV